MNKIENVLLWIVFILSVVATYLCYISGGDMLVMSCLVIPMIMLRTYRSYLLIKEVKKTNNEKIILTTNSKHC
jgi:hypothetical protein